jgi:hypothetical protein
MKKFWPSIFILAGVALAGEMPAADTGAGSRCSGTVVDGKGQPVAGAAVDFYQYQSSGGWFGGMPSDPELKQHATTGSDGGFAIASPPGASIVVVSKAGFASTCWPAI